MHNKAKCYSSLPASAANCRQKRESLQRYPHSSDAPRAWLELRRQFSLSHSLSRLSTFYHYIHIYSSCVCSSGSSKTGPSLLTRSRTRIHAARLHTACVHVRTASPLSLLLRRSRVYIYIYTRATHAIFPLTLFPHMQHEMHTYESQYIYIRCIRVHAEFPPWQRTGERERRRRGVAARRKVHAYGTCRGKESERAKEGRKESGGAAPVFIR